MGSESPYDRLGKPVDAPRVRRIPVLGSRYENPFTVAHQAVGEWRSWRSVVDANELEDPFDLRSMKSVDGLAHLFVEGAHDLTAEFNLTAFIHGFSPDFVGAGLLEVTDVDDDVYIVGLRLEDDDEVGVLSQIFDSSFFDVDEVTTTNVRLVLSSETDRHWVDIEIDIDAWFVIWLCRCIEVRVISAPTRSEVVVPIFERGVARGQ